MRSLFCFLSVSRVMFYFIKQGCSQTIVEMGGNVREANINKMIEAILTNILSVNKDNI